MARRDPYWDGPPKMTECSSCGVFYAEGEWPYCVSARNPGGHGRGVYAFKMAMSMKTNGWSRREK